MFLKLVVTIVWFLAVGAAVLSMRHARLEAVHDLANTQRRVLQSDRELWKMRAGVAELAEPGRVRRMAEGLGPLVHVIEAPVLSPERPRTVETVPEHRIASIGGGAVEELDVFGGELFVVDEAVVGVLDTGVLVITADEALAAMRRGEGDRDAFGFGGEAGTDDAGVVR